MEDNESEETPPQLNGAGATGTQNGIQVLAHALSATLRETMSASMDGFLTRLETRLPPPQNSAPLQSPIAGAGGAPESTYTMAVGKYTNYASSRNAWNDHGIRRGPLKTVYKTGGYRPQIM